MISQSLSSQWCFLKELLKRYQGVFCYSFGVLSLIFLILGLLMPKQYLSSTVLYIEENKSIKPIIRGVGFATDIQGQASIAKQVIFSQKVMNRILDEVPWDEPLRTPIEREQKIKDIIKNTYIGGAGNNLLKIEFTDKNPTRAFLTVQKLADYFIQESKLDKRQQSREAYDFIDEQAEIYSQKLQTIQAKLKELNDGSIDATPGTELITVQKINMLREALRMAQIDFKTAQVYGASANQLLKNETQDTRAVGKNDYYQSRIELLESKLASLRLSYKDDYPDVVDLRTQIGELRERMLEDANGLVSVDASTSFGPASAQVKAANPVYLSLREQQGKAVTDVQALELKIRALVASVAEEENRLKRIVDMGAILKGLQREYTANENVYKDLLEKRESARISLNLETEDKGLNLRIQEPANLPLTPAGLRFLFFVLAGPFMALLIPAGSIYAYVMIQDKIYSISEIRDDLKLPLLGVVSLGENAADDIQKKKFRRRCQVIAIFVVVFYLVLGGLRLTSIV
jgi:polysaccharide chain length determinant protein (PEP-CTERM system associated)